MKIRSVRSVAAAIVAAAGLAIAPAAHAQVAWRAGPEALAAATSPAQRAQALEALAARPDATRVVVEFGQAINNQQRAALEASGMTLLSPLGGGAYFARLDADQLNAAVLADAATADLRRVRAIDNAWKLSPMIAGNDASAWTRVGGSDQDPVIGAYVQFHPDVALNADTDQLIAARGGEVRDLMVSVNAVVIEIPRSAIDALATDDRVAWIEPALPRMAELSLRRNNENRAITTSDTAQSVYGLDGTGVNALIYDGGRARLTHSFYTGRMTSLDSSGVIGHATHVAATVGGSGVPGTGNHRGMAPNATLFTAGFEYSGGGTFLYTNPGDIENDYGNAINTHSVVLTNNSIGTNTESNGFSCEFQGQYGLTDAVIDAIARGSIGPAPIIVWAAGNERQGSRCDIEGFGDYYSSAPPAGAKNHLCIGALNANNDSMTTFSSWGPTDDGRLKPDFSAPGCQSSGDGGVTSATSSSDTATATLCGTSMASPTVCGIVALMLEDHRNQFPGRADPIASTVKALLAHTAVDLGNPGPDYQFGYGSVRTVPAIDQMRLDAHHEVDVEQGEVRSFIFDVAPGTPNIKVTAAWPDAPATPNIALALINDVDIRLISPSGAVFQPWTLNPANPSAAAVRTTANRLDNLEQVMVDNPQAGQWRCEVVGHSIPTGPQTVSIVGPAGIAERGVRVLVSSVPSLVEPGTELDIDVSVIAVEDTIVPGSVTLFARNDGGSFVSTTLTDLGGNMYAASLPAVFCSADMEFYVTAQGVTTGLVSAPSGGANAPFSTSAGVFSTSFTESFESDTGWTIANSAGLTDGAWERGAPAGDGTRADPIQDFDGSGQCYLTGNRVGNSDVDNGSTTLTSPTLDASVGDPSISYARWFHNSFGGNPGVHTLTVEISNNDGASWTNLETVGPTGNGTSGGWIHVSHRIADTITPTATMRLRFTAEDIGLQAVVEAAIDAISITSFDCTDPKPDCPVDINNDGLLDFFDVQAFLGLFAANNPAADFNDDGNFDFFDVQAFLAAFSNGCP
jgi:hypothetical protein